MALSFSVPILPLVDINDVHIVMIKDECRPEKEDVVEMMIRILVHVFFKLVRYVPNLC